MPEWEIARKLPLDELMHFQGQVIPWPPSDEDVLWWGETIPKLHKMKAGEYKGFVFTQEFQPHIPGRFGEYAFGIASGLKPCLTVWPEQYWYDYKFEDFTIDVKTRVQPNHRNGYLPLPLKEIERSKGKLADIFVLAWINPGDLSLGKVRLDGWCWKKQLLQAPIKEDWPSPAHVLERRSLRKMEDLLNRIKQVKALPEKPIPVIKKDSQKKLFEVSFSF